MRSGCSARFNDVEPLARPRAIVEAPGRLEASHPPWRPDCVFAGLVAPLVPGFAQAPAGGAAVPVVVSAEIDGIIHPVAAQYVQRTIERAEREGASLVVLTLRTPGGLVDSTRDINNAIIKSRVPVVVFVGPSGNRAASAGFLITIAADVAAMAPGTHIGAAHPVTGNGEKIDETMSKKMVSDVASYARTLAAQRNRNVELVEKAVTESRSFTEQEALQREAAAHRRHCFRHHRPAEEA